MTESYETLMLMRSRMMEIMDSFCDEFGCSAINFLAAAHASILERQLLSDSDFARALMHSALVQVSYNDAKRLLDELASTHADRMAIAGSITRAILGESEH